MANKIEKQFLDTENKGPVRLNKYLSEAGVCSRREADKLIAAGQVTVDGVRAETGMKVEPWQVVRLGKKQVSRQEEMIVLAVNKPRGIVCTEERRERDSIVRFLNYPVRITYVGRLDKDSEGLLLMTNNGDIINRMMRAANKHEKEYKVTVDKPVTDEFLKEMAGGVPILDTVTRPCQVEKLGKYKFKIILTQGLNRQIRRMCRYLGYEVQKLKRIRIMNLTLDGIREGEYREITAQEWEELNHLLESSTSETVIRTGEQNGNSSDHANERAGAKAGQGSKGVLPAGYRDHKQQRVRSDVRRASGSGERNRHCSGKQPNRKRRVRGS